MKLLGIEFKGVAGYTHQFISFENGIKLNYWQEQHRKISPATIKHSLGHLPITSEPNQPREPLVRGYADSDNGFFHFSILCLLDSDRDPVLDQDKDRWVPLCNSKTIQLRYNFSVHATGSILLEGVSVNVSQNELPIIRVSNDRRAFERLWYKTRLRSPLWEVINRSSTYIGGTVLNDGRVASTLAADDLFGPLIEFTKIRLVEAHRVFSRPP